MLNFTLANISNYTIIIYVVPNNIKLTAFTGVLYLFLKNIEIILNNKNLRRCFYLEANYIFKKNHYMKIYIGTW